MSKSRDKDIIVLDTSVILYDSDCVTKFDGYDMVVPLIVLDEVDKFRRTDSQIGRNARRFIRGLKAMKSSDNDYSEGLIRKETGETIWVQKLNNQYLNETVFDKDKNDDKIIAVCLELADIYQNRSVFLVTKDIALNVKASTLGIENKEYDENSVVRDETSLYAGTYKFPVLSSNNIDTVYSEGGISKEFVNIGDDVPYYNAGVVLYDPSSKSSVLTIYRDGFFTALSKNYKRSHNVRPMNKEQSFAMELLFDPDVKLVSLTGAAGTGKTLLAVASALSQVDDDIYDRLVISRPIQPLGKDIGYLPGPQPLDAQVLTPGGWATMGDIGVGSDVIAKDGSVVPVLGVYPKGVKTVYEVKTNEGQTTECCGDHLWRVFNDMDVFHKKPGKIKTTDQLKDLLGKEGKIKFSLPRNDVVRFDKVDLPMPPYALGALLGDGSLGDKISLSSEDTDLVERVTTELNTLGCSLNHAEKVKYNVVCVKEGYSRRTTRPVSVLCNETNIETVFESCLVASKYLNVNKHTVKGRCRGELTIEGETFKFLPITAKYTNPIKKIIEDLGLIHKKAPDKFIPSIYKFSSVEDRLDLLRGLMDTDGTVKTGGYACFYTSSEKLALDVIEVVRSLGGRSSLNTVDRRGRQLLIFKKQKAVTRQLEYNCTISLPKKLNPFFIRRKFERYSQNSMWRTYITSIEEKGEKEVQCILIDHPDHLYITDDYIVTHNTLEEKMAPWMGPIVDSVEFVFNGDRDKYYQLRDYGKLEIEPLTYIRGRSMPNTIFILDESQNVSPHEMKTIITRMGKGSKIILTGDTQQIDNNYLDMTSNGLTYAIEKFKSYDIAGHITFTKGQRSRLATLAAEIL